MNLARRTSKVGLLSATVFISNLTVSLVHAQPPAGPTTPPQDQGQIQQLQQQISSLNLEPLEPIYPGPLPNYSSNTPIAYPATPPTAFVVVGYQQTRFIRGDDGSAAFGVDFTVPHTKLGAQVALDAYSIGGNRFLRQGAFDLVLHHGLPSEISVAAGVQNALKYGSFAGHMNDSPVSYFGVITKKFRTRDRVTQPFSRVFLSGGVGTGRFRSPNSSISNSTGLINPFGSVAVNLSGRINLFTEWTGQDLNMGASIIPIRGVPFVITPAIADVTQQLGPDSGPRFVVSAGYAHRF